MLVLVQRIRSTQVSDTGPLGLWYVISANHFESLRFTRQQCEILCDVNFLMQKVSSDQVESTYGYKMSRDMTKPKNKCAHSEDSDCPV